MSYAYILIKKIFCIQRLMLLVCLFISACESWHGLEVDILTIDTTNWPDPYKKAVDNLQKGDCNKFFMELWQETKIANKPSIYLISQALRKGLILPGRGLALTGIKTTQNNQLNQDLLFFYVHSGDFYSKYSIINEENIDNRRIYIISLLNKVLVKENLPEKRILLECYEGKNSMEICKDLAVRLNIIDSLSHFINSNEISKTFYKDKARCTIRHEYINTPY